TEPAIPSRAARASSRRRSPPSERLSTAPLWLSSPITIKAIGWLTGGRRCRSAKASSSVSAPLSRSNRPANRITRVSSRHSRSRLSGRPGSTVNQLVVPAAPLLLRQDRPGEGRKQVDEVLLGRGGRIAGRDARYPAEIRQPDPVRAGVGAAGEHLGRDAMPAQ